MGDRRTRLPLHPCSHLVRNGGAAKLDRQRRQRSLIGMTAAPHDDEIMPHRSRDARGSPRRTAGADAKIIVRVDLEALLRGRTLDGETCEIAGLGPIPVSIVREWMDNAFLAAIVTQGTEITRASTLRQHVLCSVTSSRRTYPGRSSRSIDQLIQMTVWPR